MGGKENIPGPPLYYKSPYRPGMWIDELTGEITNMRTITIELRIDDDNEEKVQLIEEAAKQAAKHLWAQALLIAGKRKPDLAVRSEDMFAGSREIELLDEVDE
jgi:hypothetical protein